MTDFDYFLIGWWTLGFFLVVWSIGKQRDPMTPGSAVAYMVVQAALMYALLNSRGVL